MTKLAMTTREVAESLSLGESTIRKMVAEGRFPQPFYVGDSPRFRVSDVEKWLAEPVIEKKKVGRPRMSA